MLLSKDKYEAERLAGDLVSLNEERKSLTAAAVILAEKIVDENYTDDTVLVIYLPDCHESIAGIVAGRIREKYYKPVIVLTKGEDGVKGSARSIESYNILKNYVNAVISSPNSEDIPLRQECHLKKIISKN